VTWLLELKELGLLLGLTMLERLLSWSTLIQWHPVGTEGAISECLILFELKLFFFLGEREAFRCHGLSWRHFEFFDALWEGNWKRRVC